jgi:hypothetical protein
LCRRSMEIDRKEKEDALDGNRLTLSNGQWGSFGVVCIVCVCLSTLESLAWKCKATQSRDSPMPAMSTRSQRRTDCPCGRMHKRISGKVAPASFFWEVVFSWRVHVVRLSLCVPPACQNGLVSTTVFRCIVVVKQSSCCAACCQKIPM